MSGVHRIGHLESYADEWFKQYTRWTCIICASYCGYFVVVVYVCRGCELVYASTNKTYVKSLECKKIGKLKHTLSCVLTKVGQTDIASQPPGVYILWRVSRGGQNITKHQTMHRTKHRNLRFIQFFMFGAVWILALFRVWCGFQYSHNKYTKNRILENLPLKVQQAAHIRS